MELNEQKELSELSDAEMQMVTGGDGNDYNKGFGAGLGIGVGTAGLVAAGGAAIYGVKKYADRSLERAKDPIGFAEKQMQKVAKIRR
jgi:hypothetical protein